MNQFIVLFQKELLELYRSKKIIILVFVFLFVAVASPIFAKVLPNILNSVNTGMEGLTIKIPEPTYKDAIDQFIKNISQLALLVLIFISAGSVSDEKNKKTLELLLSKPVSRSVFVLSKFLSVMVVTSFIYIICVLFFYLYTWSIFGGFDFWRFFLLALLTLLYMLLIMAVTIFSSAVFGSGILAITGGFVAMIVFGGVFSAIEKISKFAPSYILGNYKELINQGYSSNFTSSVILTILLVLFFVSFAIILFRNQEIER